VEELTTMITIELAADPAISRSGLDSSTLLELYRRMLLSRALDLRAWSLSRQGRAHFVITSRGHEAAEVASAFALERGQDWFLPYYRSLALVVGVADHLWIERCFDPDSPRGRFGARGQARSPR
jgi:TPP-dependent pyruvate/acetoin dehydrogenase alpha subunit